MSKDGPPGVDDLRFDLGADSDGEDAPPASTLYDPTILALSPELRAKVAAREAKNKAEMDNSIGERDIELADNASPFHIMSPSPAAGKRPFQEGEATRKQILAGNGGNPKLDAKELELCFCGLLPVYPSLLVLNVVTMVAGLIVLIMGARHVSIEGRPVAGFGNANSLLISGIFLAGAVYVVSGLLLLLCGMMGIFVALMKWRHPRPRKPIMELIHQCILVLVTLLCLVLFIIMAIALTTANNRQVYESTKWSETVQAEPVHSCSVEKRLNCAGYTRDQCQFDNNKTSISFCPGHFCIDFCKVATDDVNSNSLCEPCQGKEKRIVLELVSCKAHEKSMTAQLPCEFPVNEYLRSSYTRLLVVSLASFVWMVVTVTSSSYDLCCGY